MNYARILVVEDQDDVRRLLVTALEIEGHVVDEAADARGGLKRLQEARYDLVLSDYAMPGGTGSWMLQEATAQGLLNETIALILTAHPDVREQRAARVIPKPLDLDHFLEQVRRLLSPQLDSDKTPDGTHEAARRERAAGGWRVELVLYVSSASALSMQARRNLERVLENFDASQIKFSICDLVLDPLAGDDDNVAFTPTLVKRYPEPRMWVLGDLREPEMVADLLRVCGVDART